MQLLSIPTHLISILPILVASPQEAVEPEDKIIVDGQHEMTKLQEGEWEIRLSRAYYFGRIPSDQNEMRPMGREGEWRFCLADIGIQPFMRTLVGEGRTASSGSTTCRPIKIQIEDGKLQASQSCSGGTISVPDEVTGQKRFISARNTLRVSGKYSSSAIVMEFVDTREPISPSIEYMLRPDVMRWNIKGRRLGECSELRE